MEPLAASNAHFPRSSCAPSHQVDPGLLRTLIPAPASRWRECGADEFAIQWLLNPSLAEIGKAEAEWVRYYDPTKEVSVN